MPSVSTGTKVVELLLKVEVKVVVFLAIDLVFIVRLDDLVVGLLTFVPTMVSKYSGFIQYNKRNVIL
jgi:hypothetical protein